VKEEGRKLKKCKIKFDERQYKIGVIRQKKKKSSSIAEAIIYRSFTFKKIIYRSITTGKLHC
jgi:hypothetical protein